LVHYLIIVKPLFLQCKSEAKECTSADCKKKDQWYQCVKACLRGDDDDNKESMDEVLFDGEGQSVRIEVFYRPL